MKNFLNKIKKDGISLLTLIFNKMCKKKIFLFDKLNVLFEIKVQSKQKCNVNQKALINIQEIL